MPIDRFYSPPRVDRGHPGGRSLAFLVAATAVTVAAPWAFAAPQSILPPAGTAHGWHQVGQTRTFNPSNLYDLIDGEAEAVRQYAFVSEAHAEFGPPGARKPEITVDVYDMSNPLNAFGLFGSDRISGRSVAVGTEGVQIGSSALNFWKGRYVVRTTAIHPTAQNQAAMMAYARAAASRITGPSAVPAAVRALPSGMKPRSEKYVLQNVAGLPFLRNAITADYPSAGLGAQLFIAEYSTPAAAKTALGSYQARERQFGTGLAPQPGLGQSAFHVQDRYAKSVVVAQKGRYLVGVIRARDTNTAAGLVRQALARVS